MGSFGTFRYATTVTAVSSPKAIAQNVIATVGATTEII